MKILSLTAGAASMYCGSCLRDNTLASALQAEGHDVVLVPLYTPTLTDERNVSQDKVFFGGISVYLEQHSALFRHTPWLVDRLWDSHWALQAASRRSIPVDPRLLGELTVSMLRGEHGRQRKEFRKLLRWLENEPRPEVVNLPFALLIALAEPIRKVLERPICCTLQGEDLFLEGLLEPYRSQALDLIRANTPHVDAFLPVSHYYADFMSGYLGIPRHKMHVVPLGVNVEDCSPGPRERSDVFTLGYFARVAPEKGLHLLCEIYRRLRETPGFAPARLEAAGYLAPEHKGYLQGIEQQMHDWGLADEFHYRGALDREAKLHFLQGLHVLSVPSPYNEPKGLYLLEAMANGVPVVQPRRGAFPEMLEKTGGGILAEPEDLDSIAEGILTLRRNPALARELGQRGAHGVNEHYSAAHMARRAAEVYSSLTQPAAMSA